MEPVVPDYGGASIVGVVPALVRGSRPPWFPEAARERGPVVLFLIDGLGWTTLEAHRSLLPRLAALDGHAITTVAPSTTASALTSLATGLTPAEHGIVGFRMRIERAVLNVLRWQVDEGPPPDPFVVQRQDGFLGRPVPVVTKSEFRMTKFTDAHLRGTRFVGWTTTATLVQQCRRLIGEGEPLVYAYYPGVDSVAHEFGLHDEFFRAELIAADRVGLQPLHSMVDAYAGDGRFRYLYARRGAAADLLAAARDEYGHQAWVMSRDELIDGGWLGPGPVRTPVRRRIGDVVLAAHEPVGFVDPTFPREAGLIAGHGSLTPDEMLVPLLGGRGEAR
jgi:hypothetical protein